MSHNAITKQVDLQNPDTARRILQLGNDAMHQAVASNQIVIIATQNKDDLSRFTIVADSVYDKELEGCQLTFADPKDYLRLFPDAPGNTNPPIHQPPGTEPGEDGNPVPIHKDPYTVSAIISNPKSYSDVFHERNVLDGNRNTKWAIKANPASITVDMGAVVDVGTVWILWSDGDQRQFYFNIGISKDETQDFEFIWPQYKLSSGKFNDFEGYNLSPEEGQTVKCRFIHISVKGNTKNGDWAAITLAKFTKATAVESQEVDVPQTKEPEKPEVEPPEVMEDLGREKDWGSKDDDPNNWEPVQMSNNPELWKVVDKDKVNRADNFRTKKGAEDYIARKLKEYVPPVIVTPPTTPVEPTKPIDPTNAQKVDAQGIVMIYAPKQGGQVVTAKETNQKESKHNTGTRSSLYSNKPYSANNGELTEYFIMDLSDDGEQNAPKLLSGGHTGSGDNNETRQGQCYAVGVNQNGTLHLAKEYPHHPTTPKAYDKIQYLNSGWKNLGGNIRNKLVGMKIIYFPVEKAGKKGMHIEWWFDRKGLQTGKVENDWQQMAFAEDFGDWGSKFGPPHLENMGVKYKGKVLGMYIRIDTPKRPVQFFNVGQHELELPPRKLI